MTIGGASLAYSEPQKRTAPFFDGAATPSAVAIQPDGRIVAVGGIVRAGAADTDFAIMRFLPDGSPDPGFGTAGRVTTDFRGLNDAATAVAIQPDGAVVVGGYTEFIPPPSRIAALARYTPAGVLDTGFGAGGKVIDPDPYLGCLGPNIFIRALAVAPTGDILAAVRMWESCFDREPEYEFQRYSASGAKLVRWGVIDRSLNAPHPFAFASEGRVVTLGANEHDRVWKTGRLSRFTSTGAHDTTFNGSGILDSVHLLPPSGVAVQSDDKILVASGVSLQRYTATGAVDMTYGGSGTVDVGLDPNQALNFHVVTVADSNVIAAGTSARPFSDGYDFAVVATSISGQVLLRATVDFGGNDFADTLNVSGRDVIVAGWSATAGRTDVAWVRLALEHPWQPLTGGAAAADWDGDGKADMIVTARSTGEWRIATSSTGFSAREVYTWGAPTDTPVIADFDGNRRMDLTVYRGGPSATWHVIDPALYQTAYQWGTTDDVPAPGDYDGDVRTDLAIFRPATGEWFTYDPTTWYRGTYQWGQSGDVPVPRDYDGDGWTDLAIYRPTTGMWAVFNMASRITSAYQWGMGSDVPVPGDYLGTGQMQIAVYRPSEGTWWIFEPASGQYVGVRWGAAGDVPVPGDYVGDPRTDLAIWRPSTGAWFVWDLGTSSFTAVGLGAETDPPARWVRW
jgi:uncharacterized delta-60 repeat protein